MRQHGSLMDRINQTWRTFLVCLLLGVATLTVFWPVGRYPFIIFDDWEYVVKNPMVLRGLSWQGLEWAFTTSHSSNWHPLTWVSHMLDVQLFGPNPGWHHLVNLFFHTANSLLLFLVLKRMTGTFWRSALVAGLFALHPLHVESVAWASERKNVLSVFFFMLTLMAYGKYAQSKISSLKSEGAEQRSAVRGSRFTFHVSTYYVLSLALFALGLMSKPMLVTLPFVLLLLDYWPLRRLSFPALQNSSTAPLHLVLEKLPFFALSLASSAITFVAQRSGGAVESLERVPFGARLSNALMAYLLYLQKMVWPSKLSILYLRPQDHWPAWQVALAVLLLSVITALALAPGRQRPYLTVGWFWYLGTLVPVIGLVQVGNQFMADRYTYIPLIGCFIILAWGGWELASNCRISPRLIVPVALLIVVSAGATTCRQVRLWRNTEALFEHCLGITTNNYVAHNILGTALRAEGRVKEAKGHFLEALRMQPAYIAALNNLGIMLTEQGDIDEAAFYLMEAIRLQPERADFYAKLGFGFDAQGRLEKAIAFYRVGLRLQPDQAEACNNLAWILATGAETRLRDGNEAVRLAEHACDLTGYQKTIFVGTLAVAYAQAGRFSEAASMAEKAIALATAAGDNGLAEKNRELLELYKAGKPYRAEKGK